MRISDIVLPSKQATVQSITTNTNRRYDNEIIDYYVKFFYFNPLSTIFVGFALGSGSNNLYFIKNN